MASIDDVVAALGKIEALLTKPPPAPQGPSSSLKDYDFSSIFSDASKQADKMGAAFEKLGFGKREDKGLGVSGSGAAGKLGEVAGSLGEIGETVGPILELVGGFDALGAAVGLLANPLTAIPAAIGLAVVGIVKMGQAAKDLAADTLKGVEYLKDFSGAMAGVFARKEVFDTLQNIKVGNKLAEGAGNVETSYEDISKAIEPVSSALTDIWNNGVAILVEMVSGIWDAFTTIIPIVPVLELIADMLKSFFHFFRDSENSKNLPKISPVEAWAKGLLGDYSGLRSYEQRESKARIERPRTSVRLEAPVGPGGTGAAFGRT